MMTCPKCLHTQITRFGSYGPQKTQRYRCVDCGSTFSFPVRPLGLHRTDIDVVARALLLMLEGMSLRAISRTSGLHKNTLAALLLTAGDRCARVLDTRIQNVRPKFIQADELWTFIQKKQKRLGPDDPIERGDMYLWLALDSDSKVILSYYVGKRDGFSAYEFVGDLRRRVVGRCQLTTDGFDPYLLAVEEHFGADIDFAQLIKMYSTPQTSGPDWFRPSRVVAVRPLPVSGDPDLDYVSTSHVERLNLSVRMHLRRFTRLTNAFSKSLEHLRAAVSLFVAYYNFCRVHQTLRVTPAMEAGIADHVWNLTEMLQQSF